MCDESSRSTRKLAIIEELITSKDGLIRAVKIKTLQERTNHPIAQLIPLEVSNLIADQLNSVTENNTGCNRYTTTEDSHSEKKKESHELGQAQLGAPFGGCHD